MKSTLDDQTLKVATSQPKGIEEFANLFIIETRLQCLQALLKSIDVIKWLKNETKGRFILRTR